MWETVTNSQVFWGTIGLGAIGILGWIGNAAHTAVRRKDYNADKQAMEERFAADKRAFEDRVAADRRSFEDRAAADRKAVYDQIIAVKDTMAKSEDVRALSGRLDAHLPAGRPTIIAPNAADGEHRPHQ